MISALPSVGISPTFIVCGQLWAPNDTEAIIKKAQLQITIKNIVFLKDIFFSFPDYLTAWIFSSRALGACEPKTRLPRKV
jgi:hypothetical protein